MNYPALAFDFAMSYLGFAFAISYEL